MGRAEQNAIHATGSCADAETLLAELVAVAEQVRATYSHAANCGPAYYQMAVKVLARVAVPA